MTFVMTLQYEKYYTNNDVQLMFSVRNISSSIDI